MPPRATQNSFLFKSPKVFVLIAFWLKVSCRPLSLSPVSKACISAPARWHGGSPPSSRSPTRIS